MSQFCLPLLCVLLFHSQTDLDGFVRFQDADAPTAIQQPAQKNDYLAALAEPTPPPTLPRFVIGLWVLSAVTTLIFVFSLPRRWIRGPQSGISRTRRKPPTQKFAAASRPTVRSRGASYADELPFSARDRFLQDVDAVLEKNLSDPRFGTVALAVALGFSERDFNHTFKTMANKTPTLYLREKRLTTAMVLLKSQVGTVSEIAYRVGFNDARAFTTLFQNRFGIAPRAILHV
ncbi:helix-turn-helix transcriptional regulator [Acanthopleuribacter pedis]|uniref:Helix-turn-helix transcriptional regulator n=1 Tax=Acanthopleuribacter pedis TaxID=442870 RepID=A0A8J7QCI1_9BACT|nr:helix-turn-helix transcriptional regulator [Acanthopleuribacter pedis]MBO1321957.1 helix-turn-helix transcriptional regulator [Acanthopleuribacter pedis]